MKIHYFKNFPSFVLAGVVPDDVLANPPFEAQTLNQVHGTKIIKIDAYTEPQDGDAMSTYEIGVRLMIKTADCIPLVFADTENKIIYAVHAGWRGLVADIIPITVNLMLKNGAEPSKIKVGIGPSICKKCAVFTDPKNEIPQKYHFAISGNLSSSDCARSGCPGNQCGPCNAGVLVDLRLIAKKQLSHAGILEKNIEWMPICTACDKNWFSWRRDKTQKRFGTFIELIR
ncbi:MAG: polyphenol oxidase family protein [Candidatus Gracilibacteria bacterium]